MTGRGRAVMEERMIEALLADVHGSGPPASRPG
jgi:hypothetical protein